MSYRIRVRKGDFEVEIESVDKEYVESKLKDFSEELSKANQLSTMVQPVGLRQAGDALPSGRPLSLVELRKSVNPDSGSEHTVTVGYYLEKFQGQQEYEPKELIDGLKKLGCNFKNYHDVVLKTKKIGWLMEGSSKKLLRLTNTGESWVVSRLASTVDAR